jgi:tRNA(Phe) wybutosine-synthesizing methylase Tyw3
LDTAYFKSYTVLVRNEVLTAVKSLASLTAQEGGGDMSRLVKSLEGKKINIAKAKVFDRSMRMLVIENPEMVTIGG